MGSIKIFDAELRFMKIIWEKEPISSTELVNVANEELGWKKSTTYTVIRRLCERGIIKNKSTRVESLVDREQVMRSETEEHIGKIYSGSLKLFFTTFLKRKKLSKDEIEELKEIVDGNIQKSE